MNLSEDDLLIDGHEYDGIQELDNPLPGWWLATFYATIVFSVAYWGYYELFGGATLDQELENDLVEVLEARAQAEAVENQVEGPSLAELAQDPSVVEKGRTIFIKNCASCHAPDGGGLIGPNLTDRYWIHGTGQLDELHTAVVKGFPDKGMIAWKGLLKNDEINAVTVFAKSLVGTTPSDPKEPQGEPAGP